MIRRIVLVLFCFLLFIGQASAIDITNCGTLNTIGTYNLINNITNSTTSPCINITASNITLNGNGYTVDGSDTADTVGVYIYNTSISLSNITIKNLTLTDWYSGVDINTSSINNLTDNTISSNYYGVYLRSSNSNNLSNSKIFSNYRNIYLSLSNNNTIINNTIYSSPDDSIHLVDSDNNTLKNNTIYSNDEDSIYLFSSDNNNLTGNTIHSNLVVGIQIYSSTNNTLNSNTIYANPTGILFDNSNNNLVYNNNLNNTANFNDIGTNVWNTTKTVGTNIIGGSYLGGNYWANPTGTGFSETCINADNDGICDSAYTSGTMTDYLPLTYITTPAQVQVIWWD